MTNHSGERLAGNSNGITREAACPLAGDAVLVKYQATSPPEQVTGKIVQLSAERYEFWRGGVEAIVTVSAPAGADNVDPWKTVTDSFGWR